MSASKLGMVDVARCASGADASGAYWPPQDVFSADSACATVTDDSVCAPATCAETAASPCDPATGLPNYVLKPSCLTTARCPTLKPWPAALATLCGGSKLAFGCLQRLPPPADPATVPDVEVRYQPSSLELKYLRAIEDEFGGQPPRVCPVQDRFFDEVKAWVDIAESRWEGGGAAGWRAFVEAARADGSPYSAMEITVKAPASAQEASSPFKVAPGTELARTRVPIEPIMGLMRHPFAAGTQKPSQYTFCRTDGKRQRSIWDWSYIATEAAHDETFNLRYPGRKVLVDLGGTTWEARDKNTMDFSKADSRTYADIYGSAGIEFDAVFMWEGNDVDHSVQRFRAGRGAYDAETLSKYCFALRYASPLSGRLDNAVEMLAQLWRPGDYFVFKLDIDNRPVEEAFMKIIADSSCPHIVQELIYEQHHNLPELTVGYWGTDPEMMAMTHGMALKRFVQLREMGIRAHAWV